MVRHRLPIGIRYVDKTAFIRRRVGLFPVPAGRFGKSLPLDTPGPQFACQEPLFRGLDIHPHRDRFSPHPVVRLDPGGKYNEAGDIERNILIQFNLAECDSGLPPASCGI